MTEDDLEVMIGDLPIAVPALHRVGLLRGLRSINSGRCGNRRVRIGWYVQDPSDLDDAGRGEPLAVVHHMAEVPVEDLLGDLACSAPVTGLSLIHI